MTAGGLAAGLVHGLTEEIVSGQRQPGDRLPTEAQVGLQYGVSRTVVREAMSRLQAAGLVESVRGKGSFVLARPAESLAGPGPGPAPRTADEVRELWEIRLALEVAAAGWAARRRSPTDVGRLQRALDTFAGAAERPAEALEADRAFHRALASASGNTRFVLALDTLGPAMIMMPRDRLQATDVREPGRHAIVVGEHAAILAAVDDGDADLAAAAVRVHLSASRQRLLGR